MRESNPNVRNARVWEWSGFWSLLLVVAEWALELLGAIEDPSGIARLAVAALPVVIRSLREHAAGIATSFRRRAPSVPVCEEVAPVPEFPASPPQP